MYIDINDSLVGWNSVETLIELGELAHSVPDGGWIVEASAHAGRASYALASNKQPNTILTCFELFSDVPTKADEGCFGHASTHVNYYTFKKQVVSQFHNVEAIRGDLPMSSKNIIFNSPIDMIYFNNDHNPNVWKERVESILHLIPRGGKIVIHNVHRLEEMALSLFDNDEYKIEHKHMLMIVERV